MESLTFEVPGPFRTSGAGIAEQWVGTPRGQEDVANSQKRMREAFTRENEKGAVLRQWMEAGKQLAIEAEFSVIRRRASQTDLDNLLTDLFNQMLLGLFPDLEPHERSRKDRCFYEARVQKIEVPSEELEKSVIRIRPMA